MADGGPARVPSGFGYRTPARERSVLLATSKKKVRILPQRQR
jgi:hypothetical protein